MQRRGPDATVRRDFHQWGLLHNHLSIVGTPGVGNQQPFVSERTGTAAVYNGEIYNHRELRPFMDAGSRLGESDGEVLLPAYEDHGVTFPRRLDGEFAVVLIDTIKHLVVLACDTFGTKPFWYAASLHNTRFAAASYRSALFATGEFQWEEIRPVPPNTGLVFQLSIDGPPQLVRQFTVFEFDISQMRSSSVDWETSFLRAVNQRSTQGHQQVWIGMSSGHDSGAIHCALKRREEQEQSEHNPLQPSRYTPWYVKAGEWLDVLRSRLEYAGPDQNKGSAYLVQLGESDFAEHKELLQKVAEAGPRGESVGVDPAAVALSFIAFAARKVKQLVFLSGTGADEIMSDYGHLGIGMEHVVQDLQRIVHTRRQLKLFPQDLSSIFPWDNFFMGTMRRFLMKEEIVMGAHGIETRYPFLSNRAVQEFLWLGTDVKNRLYKAPVHEFLQRYDYPFRAGRKQGFSPHDHLLPGGSLVHLLVGSNSAAALWEGLYEGASQNCLGAYLAPKILDALEQLSDQLHDTCGLFQVGSDALRVALSWLYVTSHQAIQNTSSECAFNDVALRFAGAALLSPAAVQEIAADERGGASLYLDVELSWLLDADWVLLSRSRRFRPVLGLAARAAEAHAVSHRTDRAVDCLSDEDLHRVREALRERWGHVRVLEADAMQDLTVPLAIEFLSSHAEFFTLASLGSCEAKPDHRTPWTESRCRPSGSFEFTPARLFSVHRRLSDSEMSEDFLEIGNAPAGSIIAAQLLISGSEENDVRLNGKDMVLIPRHGGGAEGNVLAVANGGFVRLEWGMGIGESNATIRALQCNYLPDTEYADLSRGAVHAFLIDSFAECCLVCYEFAACQSWQFLPEDSGVGSCWLIKGGESLHHQPGMQYGRIRGEIL